MAVLDLRPEPGSILDKLLRLGLVYDHEEKADGGKTIQYWMRYDISLKAQFIHPDDTEVIFTDIDTRLSKTVSAEELKTVSGIITWRSKYGAPGVHTGSTTSTSSDAQTGSTTSGTSVDLNK